MLRKRKRPRKECFQLDDYDAIARLLDHGYDLTAALEVIKTKRNRKRIEELHRHLMNGEDLAEHLIDIPGLDVHFRFFYEQTSLSQALHQSIGMYRYEKLLRKRLVQASVYPLTVLMITVLCFFFLTGGILPMLVDLLSSMDLQIHQEVLLLVKLARWILILMLGMIALLGCGAWFALSKRCQIDVFQWLNRYFEHHFMQGFHSYLFAGYWLEFQKQSCSTFDAISYLKQMDYRPLARYCALLADGFLLEGMDLADSFRSTKMFSESFCRYFELGIKCNELEKLLEAYLNEAKEKMERRLRQGIRAIQSITYGFVGMLVIVMAQVLFVPLDMLSMIE